MTIDEAIEIIEEQVYNLTFAPNPKLEGGYKLGIEAMERVKAERRPGTVADRTLLPGETEE